MSVNLGKMEMLSPKFGVAVKAIFDRNDVHILASIPVKSNPGTLGNLLDKLKKNPSCSLVHVTQQNRNSILLPDIVPILTEKLS